MNGVQSGLLIAVTAALVSMEGCGKSATEIAAEKAADEASSRAAAAKAQAELDADSKKFREIATTPPARKVPEKLSDAEEKRVIDSLIAELKYQLKDPSSAQIRNVKLNYLTDNGGNVIYEICGQVNSRNGFGGYAGFEYFMVSTRTGQRPWVLTYSSPTGSVVLDRLVQLGHCG